MDSKKLPFVDPPITGRLHIAFPLGIMLNNDNCWDWYYSRYIQLMCNTVTIEDNRYTDLMDLDFVVDYLWWRNCWLDGEVIPVKKLINRYSIDLHEFIMESIDEGYYLYTMLNEFFVPERYYYGKKNFDHDNIIYGYNRQERTYNVIAYNDREVYSRNQVTFDDLHKGFMETSGDQWFVRSKMKNKKSYELNIKLIHNSLKEYINSSPPLDFCLENIAFGLETFDYIKKYLISWQGDYDVRPLHTMWEHKKCMTMRIDYLHENNYLSHIDKYYDKGLLLQKKLFAQRNNLLKCNLGGKRVSNKLLEALDEIKLLDQEYMSLIAEDLYETNKNIL